MAVSLLNKLTKSNKSSSSKPLTTEYGAGNDYWEERYKKEVDRIYDWLENWRDLKEVIEKHAIVGLYDKDQ